MNDKQRILALEKAVLLLCEALAFSPHNEERIRQARRLVGVEDGDFNGRTHWVANGECTGEEGVWASGGGRRPPYRVG